MLNLSILIFIQFIFCLFFFLYFRKKVYQLFKFKDFRNEIDELIISFNRQAERHISYLETLLDNELIKKAEAPTPKATHDSPPQINETHPTSTLPPQFVKSYYANFGHPTNNTVDSNTDHKPHFVKPSKQVQNNSKENLNLRTSRQILLEKVIFLNRKGIPVNAIAKELAISTAEVKIILKLHKQS